MDKGMTEPEINGFREYIKRDPLEVLINNIDINPQETLSEMVRRGKTVQGRKGKQNLRTELVYLVTDTAPREQAGENEDGPYYNNRIILNGNKKSTTTTVGRFFPKVIYLKQGKIVRPLQIENDLLEGLEDRIQSEEISRVEVQAYIDNSRKEMVEKVFGKGMFEVFNYAHTKHIQTEAKREGTNHYFIHCFRTAREVKALLEREEFEEFGITEEYIQTAVAVALIHDVVEEMTKYRKKKLASLSEKLGGNISEKTKKGITKRIEKLNHQIKNPPEQDEIKRKFSKIHPNIGQMVFGISKKNGTEYEEYSSSIYEGIRDEIKSGTYESEEWYYLVPIVKIQDAIDNTISLGEAGATAQVKRLKRNIILAKHTYNFLEERQILDKKSPIRESLEQLISESYLMSSILKERYKEMSTPTSSSEGEAKQSIAQSLKDVGIYFQEYEETLEKLRNNLFEKGIGPGFIKEFSLDPYIRTKERRRREKT
ncbi:hypothetical protein ACFLTH_04745 [Bacteroidota bacterium]